MVEPVTVAMAGTAATKVLSNVMDDLYSFLKNKASFEIKKSNVERKMPALLQKMTDVRLVKTLWQIEYPVDVETFYCDSYLLIPSKIRENTKRRKVVNTSSLGSKRNFVIKGIAGQGKSILLRHLLVKELETGQRIPVFIEFRRIQKNEKIIDHINRFLDILEFPTDIEFFRHLLKSGKFVFFLDGFDEIPETDVTRLLNEIEFLASLSKDSQFIISTRPGTSIEMSSHFNLVSLDNLVGDEYIKFIKKLAPSSQYAKTLINAIKSHSSNISELLCTPLLITLLIISYKSYQTLPGQLSDFYESIFQILLQRHDGTKPGFIRPRLCSINDHQYREIFDVFCYKSKAASSMVFNYNQVYDLIQSALSITKLNEDVDCFLKDIKNVTCLLLEEGTQYRFIHKSVQEYYSASFIRTLPDNLVRVFYDACLNISLFKNWRQELLFLSEIDKYRYIKHFLIPHFESLLAIDPDVDLLAGPPSLTKSLMLSMLSYIEFGFTKNSYPIPVTFSRTTSASILAYETSVYKLFDPYIHDIFSERFNIDDIFDEKRKSLDEEDGEGEYKITAKEIIGNYEVPSIFETITNYLIKYYYERWLEAKDYITNRESNSLLIPMIIE